MISVIICSIDDRRFAAVKAMYHAALEGEPHEIIGVHNAASMASGYLQGITASKGDSLIFSHDDIEVISPNLAGRLKKHLGNYDLVGIAGTSHLIEGRWIAAGPPHIFGQIVHIFKGSTLMVELFGAPRPVIGNIQAMDGVFLAARRSVLSKITFDPNVFDGFHHYDLDFTFSAFHAGLKLGVACDINLVHASPGDFGGVWQEYAARFYRKWFPNIPPPPRKKFHWARIEVASKAQALAIMTPPYWNWPIDASQG